LAVSLWLVRKEYGFSLELERANLLRTVRYGAHIQVGSVAQAIGYRFDYFLINGFLGAGPLGLYSIATNWAETLWLLPGTVSTVILPRVSTTDLAAAQRATARTCRIVFSLSLLVGGVLFVFADVLMRLLYPDRFAGAAPALRWLLVGTLVFSLQKVLANYFIGQGKAAWFQWATLGAMVLNLVLNLLLIPRPGWGVVGAALASAVSYSASTIVLACLFVRWSGVKPREILVPTAADLADIRARLAALRRRAGRHQARTV
ncbi:MAG: polysaccharide biosynthesis C-terminal domain-containing protein, partial [Chloroflexota bacterium]|nr:polysaccharide biosynthesis C-terminal domain-containing protein [Chloroflexota bacterium]